MDAVITYVNGLDPVWQAEYAASTSSEKFLAKRYRDWGTLKYLLRGIERYMPFIENVYLLVSGESQVPGWIDRSAVKVVLHKDVIPSRFLPTFNSTTIEMFMHMIPGLGEEFLYFNDDMFPVSDCTPEDFFRDGKAVIGFYRHFLAGSRYKKRAQNSDHQARKALGMSPGLCFVRPQHTCSPMLKSENETLYEFSKDDIFKVISKFKATENFNQYLYLDYLYYKGKTVRGKISNKHLSPAVHNHEIIASHILKPSTKLLCINDVSMSDESYARYSEAVLSAFQTHFPSPSRFEVK